MPLRAALVLVAMLVSTGSAFADRYCNVPLGDWQPREVLQKKLETEGWSIVAIRADDGCYKVILRDARGQVTKARFDPSTLERVEGRERERHEHHDDEE